MSLEKIKFQNLSTTCELQLRTPTLKSYVVTIRSMTLRKGTKNNPASAETFRGPKVRTGVLCSSVGPGFFLVYSCAAAQIQPIACGSSLAKTCHQHSLLVHSTPITLSVTILGCFPSSRQNFHRSHPLHSHRQFSGFVDRSGG